MTLKLSWSFAPPHKPFITTLPRRKEARTARPPGRLGSEDRAASFGLSSSAADIPPVGVSGGLTIAYGGLLSDHQKPGSETCFESARHESSCEMDSCEMAQAWQSLACPVGAGELKYAQNRTRAPKLHLGLEQDCRGPGPLMSTQQDSSSIVEHHRLCYEVENIHFLS